MPTYNYKKYNADVDSGYYWDRYNANPVYAEGSWERVASGYGNTFTENAYYSFNANDGYYTGSGGSETIKPGNTGAVYRISGRTLYKYVY